MHREDECTCNPAETERVDGKLICIFCGKEFRVGGSV